MSDGREEREEQEARRERERREPTEDWTERGTPDEWEPERPDS